MKFEGIVVVQLLLLSDLVYTARQDVFVRPATFYAVNHRTVNLSCRHFLDPNSTVTWRRGSLHQSSRVSAETDADIHTSGAMLEIRHFNASRHAGSYVCTVEAEQGETLVSCPAEVVLAYTNFTEITVPRDREAFVGSTVVFQCNVEHSLPHVQTTWTHNGEPLDSLTDFRIALMPSGNLYIISVDSSRAGLYQCIATNPATLDHWQSSEVTLQVLEESENVTGITPSFPVEPKDMQAVEGSTVVLECAGQGNPQPTVSWEKTGTSSLPRGAHMHSSGVLILTNVSQSHAGSYTCKLTGGTEILQKSILLTLKGGDPNIEQLYGFAEGAANRASGLDCVATASGISEGDCQQNLYVLHNGTIVDQTIGDSNARLTHFFNHSPPDHSKSTKLYQCVSVTPTGCSARLLQASFVNGTLTDGETIQRLQRSDTATQNVCKPSTTPNNPDFYPATATATTISPLETTPHSCDYGTSEDGTEPALEVTIHYTLNCATVGSPARSTCEVTGPGSGSVQVAWLYNGTRDILTHPLENVTVNVRSSSRKEDSSATQVSADLIIESVDYMHAGTYVCSARSDCPAMHASSSIALLVVVETPEVESQAPSVSTTETTTELGKAATTVGRVSPPGTPTIELTETERPSIPLPVKPSTPPIKTRASVSSSISKDVHLHWRYTGLEQIVGFKLNWNTENRVSKSAREVVGPSTYEFTIPGSSYNTLEELVIFVWAYNQQGDGPHAEVTIDPIDTPFPIWRCSAAAANATTLELSWPDFIGTDVSSLQLELACEEGNTLQTISLPTSSSTHVISRALPSCTYTFELQSPRHIAICQTTTPEGQVDIEANVTRLPNGSSQIHFHLPPELQDEPDLQTEVNLGEGWIPVTTTHIPSSDLAEGHQIIIRLRLGAWTGSANISIPSVSSEEVDSEEGYSLTDLLLTYAIIFGTLLVTCAVMIAIVLGLKYIQWSHRERDKITDYREKTRENFFPREDTSSLKSTNSDHSTAV